MPVLSRPTPRGVAPEGWVAWPFIDTLYDYVAFLNAQPAGRIAELPRERWGTEVAVVGAGAAGLVAAYELLRIGAKPIVFEATDRLGGRANSRPFTDADGTPSQTTFAELGSMRFPPSGRLFFHYASDTFHLPLAGAFPDPGKVLTILGYENQVLNWEQGQEPPEPFAGIKRDFDNFINALVAPLYAAWQVGDMATTRRIWQAYIDRYKNTSFFAAVQQGIPSWSDEDLNRFGSLGMGSGGFGPLYQVGFLEMLRVAVNMWEDNQQLLASGVSSLMQRFYTEPVTLPDGRQTSLEQEGAVRLRTPVLDVSRGSDGNPVVTVQGSDGPSRQSFPAVIVATTIRAMQAIHLTLPAPHEPTDVVAEPVKVATRNLHMVNSSKLFIRTATKFWQQDPAHIPQNIQMDELPRGVYALDYPQTTDGVVLISYTWGDDSVKLLAMSPEERFALFKEAIRRVSPVFAENLVPVNGEIVNIDWVNEPYYFGAFKLDYPGQEEDEHAVYYQFRSVLDPKADRGVYLAGDSVSWAGGWTEGALHTGLNAACSAAKRIGANLSERSPLSQDPRLYAYGIRGTGSVTAPATRSAHSDAGGRS